MCRKIVVVPVVLMALFLFIYMLSADYRRLSRAWGDLVFDEARCQYQQFSLLSMPGVGFRQLKPIDLTMDNEEDGAPLLLFPRNVLFRTEPLTAVTKMFLKNYRWPKDLDLICTEEIATQVDSLWADSSGQVIAGYGSMAQYFDGEPQATGDGSYFLADKRGQPPHFFKTKVELDSALGFLVELRPIQDLIVKTVP